jgi:ribulose 1,5-bisphosphate carboxylase large subunit-like protein
LGAIVEGSLVAMGLIALAIAAARGIALEEYARDHEELRAALERWGIPG